MNRKTSTVAILALATLSACVGGSSEDGTVDKLLNAHGASSFMLRPFEQRPVVIRYADAEGFACEGCAVQLAIDGEANGAALDHAVLQADAEGLAKTRLQVQQEASFNILVNATDAQPISIPVTVSQNHGGIISIRVFARSAAEATDTEVTLVDNMACSGFDPTLPPAPTSLTTRSTERVTATEAGAEAVFSGLTPGHQYAAVAVGYANETPVAKGCVEGLSLTEEEVRQNSVRNASLHLLDFHADISGNTLNVETLLRSQLNLQGISNLFHEMSDSPTDPIDFVMQRALADGDDWTAILINVGWQQVSRYIHSNSSQSTQLGRAKLQKIANALANVSDVRLHTKLDISDENSEQTEGQLTAVHTVRHVTANVQGKQSTYDVEVDADFFDSPPQLKLEDSATMRLDDATRISIDKHSFKLPIAEAVISQLLMDQFGTHDMRGIFASMVDCSSVGQLTMRAAQNWMGSSWWTILIGAFSAAAIEHTCRDILTDMVEDAYEEMLEDISEQGLGSELRLEGAATLHRLGDGRTIERLSNGEWTGVGSFTAQR